MVSGHKLFVKNKAKNPFYFVNYTLTSGNFDKVVEALENKNVMIMTLTSIYQATIIMEICCISPVIPNWGAAAHKGAVRRCQGCRQILN